MVYRMAFWSRWRWTHLLPVAMLVLASTACSGDPAVEKKKQIEKGTQYLKDGKYNEAVIAFRSALQIDPNDADTHYQLGRTYRRKGWIIDARNDFEKAVQGRPDFKDARYELGQVLLEIGLPAEAEKTAGELLQGEASPRAQTLLGKLARGTEEVRRSPASLRCRRGRRSQVRGCAGRKRYGLPRPRQERIGWPKALCGDGGAG